MTYNISSQPPGAYKAKNAYEEKIGQKISWEEFAELFPDAMAYSATSIFDPVLCELAYRWSCPQGGTIIDPFAGGSVRGVVAAENVLVCAGSTCCCTPEEKSWRGEICTVRSYGCGPR